jgi:murein DD-endopeptidase MepM/ murein hydrolase activator NlpD
MTNEFRLIAALCDIFHPVTHVSLELAIPEQLVEVLPRPPLAEGETEEEWANWYFCRVYFDDGVRFTEGLVAKQNTKPFDTTIDKDEFAQQCVSAADVSGIPAENLLALADCLSNLQNLSPRTNAETGPFLFLEKSWSNLLASRPDLGLSAADRFDPAMQVLAAAAEATETLQKFQAGVGRPPTPGQYAFVRLFGRESIDELVKVAQPGGLDFPINEISGRFGSEELKGSLTSDALIAEIRANVPSLLGPPGSNRKTSEVLQSLEGSLAGPLTRARDLIGPLQLQPPDQAQKKFAGDLQLGVNAQYAPEITAAANKCNMDPAGLAALIDAEAAKDSSGLWNRNSANPTSTARGLTQFLKGTWLQMAVQTWSTLNTQAKQLGFVDQNNRVADPVALLKLRFDPALSIMSAAEYAASNLKVVMARGLQYPDFYNPATPDGKMRLAYLCHHEGAGGAAAYLRGRKAQSYVDFLDGYIDRKIVPARFRGTASSSGLKAGPGSTSQSSSALIAGSGIVPSDVASMPSTNPVEFAVLGAPQAQWHWPVITKLKNAMEIAYQKASGGFEGRESRRFLADRQHGQRFHVGLDIFCAEGDVVLAIADGTIVNFYPFYEGTNALLIAHGGIVVNYGEVAPNAQEKFNWNLKQKKTLDVTAGQPIAQVGRLDMIHFETYKPAARQNERWMKGGPRPPNLLNPTKLLLGLAAHGTRKLG